MRRNYMEFSKTVFGIYNTNTRRPYENVCPRKHDQTRLLLGFFEASIGTVFFFFFGRGARFIAGFRVVRYVYGITSWRYENAGYGGELAAILSQPPTATTYTRFVYSRDAGTAGEYCRRCRIELAGKSTTGRRRAPWGVA